MKKRITSLVLSIVLVCIIVFDFKNNIIFEVVDNLVLLENRHPGYWNWLRTNAIDEDIDEDGKTDTVIYPVSKVYKNEITLNDYNLFLKDATRDKQTNVVYFLDGTGIDAEKNIYGDIDINSWIITDGRTVDWSSIRYLEKSINEVTDIYQYLNEINKYSFIISVRDDAASSWNSNLQQIIESYGLKGGFHLRDSYIAIVESGKVLDEQVSHDTLDYYGSIQGKDLYVKSSGYDAEYADSIISINNIDYSLKGRGLNIVVLQNGNVIDSVTFDTCDNLLMAKR